MNKILNRLFILTALVMALSSCKDEAEIPGHGKPGNPEKEVAGTYVGTWTKTQRNSTADPVTAEGTLTLTATDEAYITVVKIGCESASMDFNNTSSFASTESRANIVNQSAQYVFYNVLTTNGLGTSFNGTVSFGGEATMTFAKTIRQGRVTYTYDYTFTGTKQ